MGRRQNVCFCTENKILKTVVKSNFSISFLCRQLSFPLDWLHHEHGERVRTEDLQPSSSNTAKGSRSHNWYVGFLLLHVYNVFNNLSFSFGRNRTHISSRSFWCKLYAFQTIPNMHLSGVNCKSWWWNFIWCCAWDWPGLLTNKTARTRSWTVSWETHDRLPWKVSWQGIRAGLPLLPLL